ncbi:MAG: response regulator transcription factor, partial [Paracoccaceae bacterium]
FVIVDDVNIRMVVLDKDPIFALGLCSLLEKRPDIQATAFSCADLFEPAISVNDDMPDIALVDPGQFDLTPYQLAHRLKLRFGARGIIGYTADTPITEVRSCLAAGFSGILPRDAGLEPLMAAIAAVHGGAVCIDPSYVKLFEVTPLTRPATKTRDLTEREIYVLKAVAFGKSLKEIGLELELSSKTIETYKARGSSKLNLQGRRAIVEYAIRSGWVQAEERSA